MHDGQVLPVRREDVVADVSVHGPGGRVGQEFPRRQRVQGDELDRVVLGPVQELGAFKGKRKSCFMVCAEATNVVGKTAVLAEERWPESQQCS